MRMSAAEHHYKMSLYVKFDVFALLKVILHGIQRFFCLRKAFHKKIDVFFFLFVASHSVNGLRRTQPKDLVLLGYFSLLPRSYQVKQSACANEKKNSPLRVIYLI